MITVRLPRLLDSNLREVGRLHPVDGGLNLNMVPISTASLEVLTKDAVPGGSWIEMYSPYGSAGIYRVSTVSSGYGSEVSTLELEHGISEVGDSVVNAEISQEMGLNSAISTLWGYYKGNRWKLGSNPFSDRVLVDVMYDNLLQAILGVLDQTTGYMMAFDFSTSPWTVNIVRKGTAVAAEGRLSRNVQEATVTVDRTEQCTRVYMDYDSDEGSGGTLSVDADNISQYGVIESHQTGSGYTYDQAYAVAKDYVEKHKNPAITVSITGVDFAKVTGESLDVLEVGKLYRLAIPKYRVVVEENITALNWSHLYTDPTSVEVVLGPEQDKVVSYMHTTTESISRGGKGTVKKQGRYWTRFERTDHYIDQVAAYTDENGNILKQAGMYIDANGVLQYAQDNEKQIGSQFKVAADRITAEVTQRENGERALYSSIEQTASRIRLDVVNVKEGLESSITQTASRIDLDIKNTKEGLESQISQTDSDIRLFVGGVKSDLQSEIKVERDRIGLVVSGSGENAKIKPASIVASINNATKESSVLISADRISLTGTTTINDAMTVQNGNILVKYAALFGTTAGSQVSINNGSVNAKTLQVNSGGKLTLVGSGAGEHYDITTSVLQGVIKSASVSGNVLTLTPFYGDAITFSKATSLSGGWSSVGGVNKYRVTAKQNGVIVATHDYDPPMRLNGTTAASNFSAEITETSGSTTTGKKSIYGYLVKGGSSSSSYVDVNTAQDGTGTSVARLGVGSVYTSGQNNVTITKGAWANGKIDFTKSAGTASTKSVSLIGGTPTANESTVSIEIWDGESADVYHGSKTGYTATASLQTKSVTSNGDVTPDSGYVGLSKVTVNVPSGGSPASAIQIDSSTWYNSSDPAPAYDANLSNTGRLIAKNKVGYVYFRAYVQDGSGEKWYRIPIDTR